MEAGSDFKTVVAGLCEAGRSEMQPGSQIAANQPGSQTPATAGRLSRRVFFQVTAAGSLALISGCGMILHPERRGQPPGGSLDWSIVALDGIGLLLFFIPGVIAFAVDFATGTIFLPPSGYGAAGAPASDEQLVEVHVPPQELSPQRVEQVASQHAGRDVRLVRGEFFTAPLTKLADFWPTRRRLERGAGSTERGAESLELTANSPRLNFGPLLALFDAALLC